MLDISGVQSLHEEFGLRRMVTKDKCDLDGGRSAPGFNPKFSCPRDSLHASNSRHSRTHTLSTTNRLCSLSVSDVTIAIINRPCLHQAISAPHRSQPPAIRIRHTQGPTRYPSAASGTASSPRALLTHNHAPDWHLIRNPSCLQHRPYTDHSPTTLA